MSYLCWIQGNTSVFAAASLAVVWVTSGASFRLGYSYSEKVLLLNDRIDVLLRVLWILLWLAAGVVMETFFRMMPLLCFEEAANKRHITVLVEAIVFVCLDTPNTVAGRCNQLASSLVRLPASRD